MAQGIPGYPTNAGLLQQAQQAAQAAVPTKQSIMHQYGQSIGDVSGFTQALLGFLKGANIGGGYTPAIAQQGALDNAAAQRIAAVTGQAPTAAASTAAVGGLGSSAMSHLISSQAAARTYGAQLPAIGAARGALAQQSLITGRNQALQQRNQEYHQALQQALQQAQANAGQLAGLRFNQRQAAADNAYRYAALAQNQRQFSQSQALQFQEFQARLKASLQSAGSSGSGPGGALAGYTPSEVSQLQSRASKYAQDTAVTHGVPITVAIRNLMAQGIPRPIAVYTASEAYGTMTAPTQAEFGKGTTDSKGNPTYNGLGYQQALKAYHVALGSFRKWVNQRQFNSWAQANARALAQQGRRRKSGRGSS